MFYASVHDLASSWPEYERVPAVFVGRSTAGLVVHMAGPTDEGVRIIDLWVSELAAERFHARLLAPALADLGGGPAPRMTTRALHPKHVFVAPATDGAVRLPTTGHAR